jgi:CheY-like chemotaxis protein
MSTPPSILIVEDDDQVRGFVRTLLVGEGYRILEGRTGAEGILVAEQADRPPDVLLSDMLLPELSGYDLAVTLREKFPQLKVILMTGYVEGEIVQRCISELNATFLDKPFQPAQLRKVVRDMLGAPGHSAQSGLSP